MAIVKQLNYISVNKAVTIVSANSEITGFNYGTYGAWTTFKTPAKATKKRVAYKKSNKAKYGKAGALSAELSKNHVEQGTTIKYLNSRTVNAQVFSNIRLKYKVRSYTKYGPKFSKTVDKKKKYYQYKYYWKRYQYRLYFKDVAKLSSIKHIVYSDSRSTVFFNKNYIDATTGTSMQVKDVMQHPTEFEITYSDLDANLDGVTEYSGRNTSGIYIRKNLRSNIATIKMKWEALSKEDTAELLAVISSGRNTYASKKSGSLSRTNDAFVDMQYWDALQGKVVTKTFFSQDRAVIPLANGMYDSIEVTMVEV